VLAVESDGSFVTYFVNFQTELIVTYKLHNQHVRTLCGDRNILHAQKNIAIMKRKTLYISTRDHSRKTVSRRGRKSLRTNTVHVGD